MQLKALLVKDDHERGELLRQSLQTLGHEVVSDISVDSNLLAGPFFAADGKLEVGVDVKHGQVGFERLLPIFFCFCGAPSACVYLMLSPGSKGPGNRAERGGVGGCAWPSIPRQGFPA